MQPDGIFALTSEEEKKKEREDWAHNFPLQFLFVVLRMFDIRTRPSTAKYFCLLKRFGAFLRLTCQAMSFCSCPAAYLGNCNFEDKNLCNYKNGSGVPAFTWYTGISGGLRNGPRVDSTFGNSTGKTTGSERRGSMVSFDMA